MWCWTALTLLVLLAASVAVGVTWLGLAVQQNPLSARLAVTEKVWLPAVLVVWICGTRALQASARDSLAWMYGAFTPIGLGITVLALSELVEVPAAVVVLLPAFLNLGAYFLVWLLFWPGHEDRCPTWLS
jgi:hypothetical protein